MPSASAAPLSGEDQRRLAQLAAFVHEVGVPDASFGNWQSPRANGAGGSYVSLGFFKPSEVADRLIRMLYAEGWILRDFDWERWVRGPEGRMLIGEQEEVSGASATQLSKLLTSLVQQDRFCEGALAEAFETGLLLGIAEREQALLDASRSPPK